jgi:streptogramin lyase
MSGTGLRRILSMALVALVAVASSAAAGTRATPARVAATISIPGFPALVATGYGSVWVAGHRNGVLYRINPGTNHVTGKLSLPGPISGAITVGGGGVWVQSSPASGGAFAMYRINPSTMRITTRHEGVSMAIAAGSWWFSSFDQHAVLRVKPATGHVTARIVKLGVDNNGVNPVTGAAFGSVWVYSPDSAFVRISTATNRVTAVVPLPGAKSSAAITNGFLSGGPIAFTGDSALAVNPAGIYRIDPQTNLAELLPVKLTPFSQWGLTGIAIGTHASVFVRTSDRAVSQIDPQSGTVLKTYPASGGGGGIALGFGALWVANAGSGTVSKIPLP